MKKLNNLLSMRSYLILWAGQTVSLLGTSMTSFALIVYVFKQQQTALSVALLPACTIFPALLFCFIAGTLADKWDKRKIILAGYIVGALGTLTVFLLYGMGSLQVWHLYTINLVIGVMSAFQNPATYVAMTLLVPREQYVQASAVQTFSIALVNVLGPAAATAILTFGGIRLIFLCDLLSFAAAFGLILAFVKLPPVPNQENVKKEPFLKSCTFGFRFLRENKPLFVFILYMSAVNLLASLGGDGNMMPALVLARTGTSEIVLGVVKTAVGLGALAGSVVIALKRPSMRLLRELFIACGFSFLICDLSYAFGQSPIVWVVGAFAGNVLVPFITANSSAMMRLNIPVEYQGRVFAARDTIQNLPYPIGLFVGGLLADRVFEPFMTGDSPVRHALSFLVGTGRGSGMALIMLCTGLLGGLLSFLCLKSPMFGKLKDSIRK